jgi:hypothetical protein
LFFFRRRTLKKQQEARHEELRAREAARLASSNNRLQGKGGFSNGVTEVPTRVFKGNLPGQYSNDPVKKPQGGEYHPAFRQQYQQQYQSVPQQQVQSPYQVSPPRSAHGAHELEYNSTNSHHGSPHSSHMELLDTSNCSYEQPPLPLTAAQELAAARLRSNISPMGAEDMGGNSLNYSASVVSHAGFELQGASRMNGGH